jgi:hypothetical protein
MPASASSIARNASIGRCAAHGTRELEHVFQHVTFRIAEIDDDDFGIGLGDAARGAVRFVHERDVDMPGLDDRGSDASPRRSLRRPDRKAQKSSSLRSLSLDRRIPPLFEHLD